MQKNNDNVKPLNVETKERKESGRSHEKRHERPGASGSAERDTSLEGRKKLKCAEARNGRVSERALSTSSAME